MELAQKPALVTTIKERCRMCYTCVRECPAKAIRVVDSQASVVPERCIGCGNCIRICSQGAKTVADGVPLVEEFFSDTSTPVAALIAPSFPAEFQDFTPQGLVGALHSLGFSAVYEVAFGADMVAMEYNRILATTTGRYIATTCPAIVSYVRKYHPDLVSHLMPVVSPMLAMARVARKLHGSGVRLVFVGPCIAKKNEALDECVNNEIQAVLTFSELRNLFARHADKIERCKPASFSPPRGAHGGLFALSRGLLQAADLQEDLLRCDVIAVEGNPGFASAIHEFERGGSELRLLELLSCEGCIMGAGFTNTDPALVRRRRVSDYVTRTLREQTIGEHHLAMQEFAHIPLHRTFTADSQLVESPSPAIIHDILAGMDKNRIEDELNCGACGYHTCREHAVAIFRGLAEPEMCLPYTIEHLRDTVKELKSSHADLLRVKEALTHSEKLASMGQVAAGIAHELNNPLGIILLYSTILVEQLSEENTDRKDIDIIVQQANRCKKIVNGLLNFARRNKVMRETIEVSQLFNNAIESSKIPPEVQITVNLESPTMTAYVDKDQMVQLLCNLIDNAVSAMPNGGSIALNARTTAASVVLAVHDSGSGIRSEHLASIFEPFFSTKPVGKGTGLGLSVVHGIIKMHQGKIDVKTNNDPNRGPTGTRFTITLPQESI